MREDTYVNKLGIVPDHRRRISTLPKVSNEKFVLGIVKEVVDRVGSQLLHLVDRGGDLGSLRAVARFVDLPHRVGLRLGCKEGRARGERVEEGRAGDEAGGEEGGEGDEVHLEGSREGGLRCAG